jgi:hypothetical protein
VPIRSNYSFPITKSPPRLPFPIFISSSPISFHYVLSVRWAGCFAPGEGTRDAEEEETRSDNENNTEDDNNTGFVPSPILSLDEQAVDGFASLDWGESGHCGLEMRG